MNIISFLSYLKEFNFGVKDQVLYVQSKVYPLLFLGLCKAILQKKGIHIQTLDVQGLSEAILTAQLEMSFLDMHNIYWLTGIDQLDEKKQLKIFNYCNTYTGPHILIVCINESYVPGSHKYVVTLDTLGKAEFNELALLLYPAYAQRSIKLSAYIFKQYKTIPFDSAWLLVHYSILLGVSIESFVQDWLDNILAPEKSLFTLSSAFFARKSIPFFTLWEKIKDEYPGVFWTTYWSEQFIRAYFYIALMQDQNTVEAKRIAYRLPFSFIQKDWHKVTLPELQKAHDLLYTMDHNNKNSLGIYGFELIFAQFLNATL